uniref:Photolyase/cryptochrome alpha/beta domain-containing protein n=1 Tax=Peronospora matthiolae TaxID=2874970 RepID=A0AAV1V426_9STRA
MARKRHRSTDADLAALPSDSTAMDHDTSVCSVDSNGSDRYVTRDMRTTQEDDEMARTRPTRRAIIWFRRDLRLHDNVALDGAIRAQQDAGGHEMALLPLYIVHRPKRQRCGAVRFQFLLESVADLAKSFAALNGRLLVLRGDAEEVLTAVMAAWSATDLFFEEGVVHYAVARDDRVRAIAASLNIKTQSFRGVTLYDPHEIIDKNGGQPPADYERLLEITDKMAQPAVPIAAPLSLLNAAAFSTNELFAMLCQHDSSAAHVMAGVNSDTAHAGLELFAVPHLTELGLTPPDPHTPFIGGESEAMKRLDAFCKDERRVGLFEKPKTSPVAIDAASTTTLSPYLTFGCLSAREFFYRIMYIQLHFRNRPGPTQVTLEGQLMWREFFYCYACSSPDFDSLERNPICKQVDWRLLGEEYVSHPELDQQCLLGTTDAEEKLAMYHLQCWKDGRTGFPWIDAVMRQIKLEGWTHHAGRHAVACFLTRGGLYISWLRGATHFQETTIDMDWPINVGNWLWVSASCFFSNYRQVASPSTFPRRWDKQGRFIRKYIPALRNMPDKYVHEPWKSSLKEQRNAGCLIGKDYPFPIIDFKHAMTRCLASMGQAYSDSETESTTTPGSSTSAPTGDMEAGDPSPWDSDDMCYSYRGPTSSSQS